MSTSSPCSKENCLNGTTPASFSISSAERWRWLAVERHVVVVGEIAEELFLGLGDVMGMLDQAVGVDVTSRTSHSVPSSLRNQS